MEGRKNNTGGRKSIFVYQSYHIEADTQADKSKTQFLKITDLEKVNRLLALKISYFCSCILSLPSSVVEKL